MVRLQAKRRGIDFWLAAALLLLGSCVGAPVRAPGPMVIDFQEHGTGPLSLDWFAPEGLHLTEGSFVSRARGRLALIGPVAGYFENPVRKLAVEAGAYSAGDVTFTLTGYDNDGNVVGVATVTGEFQSGVSTADSGLELGPLEPPAAAFTLDATLVEPRPNGDSHSAFSVWGMTFCAAPDEPAALPPERRGCLHGRSRAARQHGPTHVQYIETGLEGDRRARQYAERDLDCPDGRAPQITLQGLPQEREPRIQARCDGHDITWYWGGQKRSESRTEAGQMLGTWRAWHPNGQLEMETPFVNGKREGRSLTWNEDGGIVMEVNYVSGKVVGDWNWYYPDGSDGWRAAYREGVRDGPYIRWHQNGATHIEGVYVRGKRQGVWRTYDAHGKTAKIERWEDGEVAESSAPGGLSQ